MAENTIFTVSQITASIKTTLESRFSSVEVQGEITNIKMQSSGHIYFSLKDENAQISAACFRGNAQKLRMRPKSGDKVVVSGELSVYPPRGGYQIIVRSIKPAGVGDLLLKLHELKLKLQKKGYFDKERKKALPKYPKTLCVITSPTGAVIQDILHVLKRRHGGFHLALYPVKVQGEGAAEEIAQAIWECNKYRVADVLIIGRGGGSLEDLWAFNSECVADALFASEIPTIAAVGHETDFSIADFVADVRAPTPSAAAEIALKERAGQLEFLGNARRHIQSRITSLIQTHKAKLERYAKHPIFRSPYAVLQVYIQKLDDLQYKIDTSMQTRLQQTLLRFRHIKERWNALTPLKQLEKQRLHIEDLNQRLDRALTTIYIEKKRAFASITAHLESIHPNHLLQRGYCISFDENSGSVIMSAEEVRSGQKLRLLYADGHVSSQITHAKQTVDAHE